MPEKRAQTVESESESEFSAGSRGKRSVGLTGAGERGLLRVVRVRWLVGGGEVSLGVVEGNAVQVRLCSSTMGPMMRMARSMTV